MCLFVHARARVCAHAHARVTVGSFACVHVCTRVRVCVCAHVRVCARVCGLCAQRKGTGVGRQDIPEYKIGTTSSKWVCTKLATSVRQLMT